MKRVLSIDWDYFINATAKQRSYLFPDGCNESISYKLQDFIWNTHYSSSLKNELRSISILKDDYELIHYIIQKFVNRHSHTDPNNLYTKLMSVAISHKWIYDFVMQRIDKDEEFEVYNIDFHHDMYCYKTNGEEVNCGNWVNCLLEKRPNMKYYWVKREDSDSRVIGGEVDCKTKPIEELKDLDFDYVFICRSDCWSPPHLDNYFETLWALSVKYLPVDIKGRIMSCRKITELTELENHYAHELALSKGMIKYPNANCPQCGAVIPEGSSSLFCYKCSKGK